MKKTKKILSLVLAAALLVTATVATTVAYLTDTTAVVNNTFSVGKVDIDLNEAPVDEYGAVVEGDRRTTNTYKLIPGHTYTKDPRITVASDSENCYLFVKVSNSISGIEAAGNTTIAAQMKALGWTDTNGNGIYVYKDVVSANDTVNVFNNFTLADEADLDSVDTATAAIKVIACAVQADGLSASKAEEAVPATFTFN